MIRRAKAKGTGKQLGQNKENGIQKLNVQNEKAQKIINGIQKHKSSVSDRCR